MQVLVEVDQCDPNSLQSDSPAFTSCYLYNSSCPPTQPLLLFELQRIPCFQAFHCPNFWMRYKRNRSIRGH